MNVNDPQALLQPNLLTLNALSGNLKRLLIIRMVLLTGTATAVAYAYLSASMPLLFTHLSIILVGLTCINILSAWRVKKHWPVTEIEFFLQLLIEVASLTLILFYAGGSTNPFVSYYLIPIIIAAATLPWHYTWTLSTISLVAYTGLLFYYIPITDNDMGMSNDMSNSMSNGMSNGMAIKSAHQHVAEDSLVSLHIIGMWFNFLMSALLISWFVVRMANALRNQENHINEQKENVLRDEQIMAVATIAAGTTHELGTPLTTITVLLDELMAEHAQNPNLQADLATLQEQTALCTNTLRRLANTAEQYYKGSHDPIPVADYIDNLLDHWLLLRPDVNAAIHIANDLPDINIQFPPTVEQSILNLLQNSADASPQKVSVTVEWDLEKLKIIIKDSGPGITREAAQKMGKPFFTTKGKGLGLGLFLTHASLNRYGGQVKWFNDTPSGTITELTLPFASLHQTENHRD
ncbi:MAG: ATP-binding protein [Gammaproteobacteria bacterium]|nr:MAG: ATP-binding protein [Gammaproteobacteria bacterium]